MTANEAVGLLTHLPLALALQLAPIVARELDRSGVVTHEGTIWLDCVAPTYHRRVIVLARQYPNTFAREACPRAWVIFAPESD